ncbi:peptidylprolyl isomerase [Neolewinella persica]|uniref:peptidylprolyl isomerase n=1 Tax=Neolewinella persica TaxID=70998 RepID=UPI0003715659|nr:peptidylprolyl isomerase [Neolewinella persica]
MRQLLKIAIFALVCTFFTACTGDSNTVLIKTNKGDITVELFDETPRHKENFQKMVKEKYYDGLLFHRVMPGFMIQGGDPNSRGAAAGAALGMGGPGYTIDHEIGQPHLRGALAAARTPNPEKASSGSQFYIVTGQPQAASALDQYERMKGIKYSEAQRAAYIKDGGRPDLDMDYTVFGQVVSGMEVVDAISAGATGAANRPVEDVVIESVSFK